MEQEKYIGSLHENMRKAHAPLITEVHRAILDHNNASIPEHHLFYKGIDNNPSEDFKLVSYKNFIVASYATVKAQNVFHPNPKRTDAIESIDKIVTATEELQKTNPF